VKNWRNAPADGPDIFTCIICGGHIDWAPGEYIGKGPEGFYHRTCHPLVANSDADTSNEA
jgi:hypothetical protein